MTNMQIIMTEVALAGITEEVDTYAGWKRRGYQVQKGNKALFKTRIWKPVKLKKDDEETELRLVNANFFGRSQVEKAS